MPTLYYVHDPMCSWCYAFAPTWRRIEAALPSSIALTYVLGGLAPDTEEPMPRLQRDRIQGTWRRIQSVVPGTEFNFEFWSRCTPRRSTYPACRAVLTAKHLDPALERPMIASVQRAYYLEARNPSDPDVLCALADNLGLDPRVFRNWLESERCQALLEREIHKARDLGVTGFPSLVLEDAGTRVPVPYSHADPQLTLAALGWAAPR